MRQEGGHLEKRRALDDDEIARAALRQEVGGGLGVGGIFMFARKEVGQRRHPADIATPLTLLPRHRQPGAAARAVSQTMPSAMRISISGTQ